MPFRDFMNGYNQCALWLCGDTSDDGLGIVYFLDNGEDVDSIEETSALAHEEACRDFYEANKATWREQWLSDEDAGHNFFLTRNGHGTGFWDRGLGEAGKALTEACRPYGGSDLYREDDGKLYWA